MQRKVIQQGPSTLMVSLPSKWAKENNIKKGDDITLEIVNNQLVLYSQNITKEKKATIVINKKEEYLDRMVMRRYREGYDEIYIKYKDPATIEKIKETLVYLLGFEIVNQGRESCTIKNISQGSHENYTTMFRRMFQIVLTMSESCLSFVTTKEESNLKTAIDLRETLIKLEQFNLRLINAKNNFSLQQKSLEYFYVWNIATFGKIWASLAKKQLSKKRIFSTKDVAFFKEVVAYTRDFYEAFYKREERRVHAMKQKLHEQRPIGEALLSTSKNRMVVFYLLRTLNRVHEMTLTF